MLTKRMRMKPVVTKTLFMIFFSKQCSTVISRFLLVIRDTSSADFSPMNLMVWTQRHSLGSPWQILGLMLVLSSNMPTTRMEGAIGATFKQLAAMAGSLVKRTLYTTSATGNSGARSGYGIYPSMLPLAHVRSTTGGKLTANTRGKGLTKLLLLPSSQLSITIVRTRHKVLCLTLKTTENRCKRVLLGGTRELRHKALWAFILRKTMARRNASVDLIFSIATKIPCPVVL
mmetsp:Transcript_12820/g.37693  ORF Transcript_12820/g.37693 Transcript_12820/m.37693 type:complete len:230 (+) Transcript_12820:738-1427(+)